MCVCVDFLFYFGELHNVKERKSWDILVVRFTVKSSMWRKCWIDVTFSFFWQFDSCINWLHTQRINKTLKTEIWINLIWRKYIFVTRSNKVWFPLRNIQIFSVYVFVWTFQLYFCMPWYFYYLCIVGINEKSKKNQLWQIYNVIVKLQTVWKTIQNYNFLW